MQGRNETIEKYYETIRDFNAMGLWVATFDLRGQGGSDRLHRNLRHGHVRRFSDYERDLEIFLDKIVLPDARLPFFLVGHSTGALIALSAAPRLTNRISRMALSAPYIALSGQGIPERLIRTVAAAASWTGLGGLAMGGNRSLRPFENNPLTSDRRRFERNTGFMQAHPELHLGPPTARWLRETFKAADRVRDQRHLTKITIPTLLIAPVLDGLVPYRRRRNCRAISAPPSSSPSPAAATNCFRIATSIAPRRWQRSAPSCPASMAASTWPKPPPEAPAPAPDGKRGSPASQRPPLRGRRSEAASRPPLSDR